MITWKFQKQHNMERNNKVGLCNMVLVSETLSNLVNNELLACKCVRACVKIHTGS